MYEIRRNESRFHRESDWLKSSFSFSFADYYEEDNRSFGPLCVFNEDVIAGGRGFGAHPHREMEIVSVVLSGKLKHEDSAGNSAVTTYGGVQRMTAGTGIVHSEVNPDSEEPVHLLQIWFTPQEKRLTPSYETSSFDPKSAHGGLLPIVSRDAAGPGAAGIHQDVNLFLSVLDEGAEAAHYTAAERLLYVFVIDGNLAVQETDELQSGDTLRASGLTSLSLRGGAGGTRLLLIDMAAGQGEGGLS
ncbi:pirin family protein [Paenibacillus pasadenensis]|uniref:pirin family protein n=1 Tax=Paenibacillus pasadenensis TaxID=217090 RepID=UPI00203D6528|nr:pirin-like bicupin family protein [Paenibacillus pasadenensis]MCM3748366.1 pirin family protein [Paenibacillus pasadenensis]